MPGIDRKRLLKKFPVKVCPFLEASANDIHHYPRLLLQKHPDTNILLVGTSNCVSESSRVVLDKIFKLTTFTPELSITVENYNFERYQLNQ